LAREGVPRRSEINAADAKCATIRARFAHFIAEIFKSPYGGEKNSRRGVHGLEQQQQHRASISTAIGPAGRSHSSGDNRVAWRRVRAFADHLLQLDRR
jgi:hypothetical protein